MDFAIYGTALTATLDSLIGSARVFLPSLLGALALLLGGWLLAHLLRRLATRLSRDERALSKVSFAVRRRLPWLHINLGTAFLAAAVVGLFDDTIAQFTALAVLLPVVAGQSGNTGAQALAVTMRGLALREVRPRQWLRIAFKESRVALINGVAVSVTTSAGVWLWSQSPGLALVIGLAMVISMLAAGLAGAVIPILLTVSGQDPAQASSIIPTTATDVVRFLSLLDLAAVFASLL
ncbi:MAG: magnesium transporter [Acidimicrobiia bacterium]|nr:magnesium transporter [Acidimicrobiia bacterium]